ncbi:MAG: V-type ATP synthase subunit F [Nitrospinota bacterium]
MSKVAFIGKRDAVLGFAPLGVEVYMVEGVEEAGEALERAIKSGASAIFLSEELAPGLSEKLEALSRLPLPALTILPGPGAVPRLGRERLRRHMEKALGTDALFQEEMEGEGEE